MAVQGSKPATILLNVCGALPKDPYAIISCGADPSTAVCAMVNGVPTGLGSAANRLASVHLIHVASASAAR